MNDGAFGLAHVIFHLALVAVLHGSRSPRAFKSRSEQIKSRSANKLHGRHGDAPKQLTSKRKELP
jgi:hypothetical protein